MGTERNQEPVEFPEYKTLSLHSGLNTFINGRLLTDSEATDLVNVENRIPGKATKIPAPITLATLDTGLTNFIPQGLFTWRAALGDKVVAIIRNSWFDYDGFSLRTLTAPSTNVENQLRAAQYASTLYLSDADTSNPIFKYTGSTTVTSVVINDASDNPIQGVTALASIANRLWLAVGTTLNYSDILFPESFNDPVLNFIDGAGDTIVGLLPLVSSGSATNANTFQSSQASTQFLVFKSDGHFGSVYLVDLADNNPDNFVIGLKIDRIPAPAFRTLLRLGQSDTADTAFYTAEGLKTLASIQPIRVMAGSAENQPMTYPSITRNVASKFNQTDFSQSDTYHAVYHEGRFVLWLKNVDEDQPNVVVTTDLNTPRNSALEGWTTATCMPAFASTVAQFADTAASIILLSWDSGNVPILQTAFALVDDVTEYKAVSKRITFDDPGRDKDLLKLQVMLDATHVGAFKVYIIGPDDTEYLIKEVVPPDSILALPFFLPALLPTGSIRSAGLDLHYTAAGQQLPRMTDARVMLTSIAQPAFIGFNLYAHVEMTRWVDPSEYTPETENSNRVVEDT